MLETSLWTPTYFIENTALCTNALKDEKLLQQVRFILLSAFPNECLGSHGHFAFQIPSLNSTSDIAVHDTKLVRYRGMIQDILNPVYYPEKLKIRNVENDSIYYRDGKYCDVYLDVKENSYS